MENFFVKYITNNLPKIPSLFFGAALLMLFFSAINSVISEIIINLYLKFIIYGIIILIWVAFWFFYKFKYPKNKKSKIGLVVAIYAESSLEEIRIKNDFIRQLQRNINTENFSELINIIVLKNHLSEKIKTANDVRNLAVKTRGHFFLYGDIRKSKDNGGTYFLNLDGLVIHTPIPLQVSNALKNDFISMLPKEISFLETFEFKGFSFTADIVYLCVRYITGLAAYLSGDAQLAIKLHTNLRQDFNKFKPLPLYLQNIRNKVPAILSNEKIALARYYFLKGDIVNSVSYLNEALNDNNQNYSAWLLKSVEDFKIDNKPEEALKSIGKAQTYSNNSGEWRYSKAFLLFWIGRYSEALSQCVKIKNGSYIGENITLEEVEKFNLDLLQNNNKPQLYFWLGFLNYRKKQNFPKALEYFEKFEEQADNSMGELKQKSTAYLIEIKREMNLS